MRWLSAVLCTLLAGCAPVQTGNVRIDPALVSLIPGDTVLLAGVRMDALRETPLYKRFAGRPMPGLDELARETGLDLRRDLWELLVASNGKETVMMARGKFSETGLEPRLNREGLRRTPYKGYTLIGNDDGAVVFMNSTTAVAGRPAAVRAIIDQRARAAGIPPPLRDELRSIPAGNQLWVAGSGGFDALGAAVPQAGNLANLGRVLSMVQRFSAAADLRSGLKAYAAGLCNTDQDAKSLGDALRGLVGFARLSAPDNQPEMLRLYDGIHVDQQQRTVRVNVEIPEDLLENAIARWQQPPERPTRESPPPRRR